jgi:hypothetical protein
MDIGTPFLEDFFPLHSSISSSLRIVKIVSYSKVLLHTISVQIPTFPR